MHTPRRVCQALRVGFEPTGWYASSTSWCIRPLCQRSLLAVGRYPVSRTYLAPGTLHGAHTLQDSNLGHTVLETAALPLS